MFVIRIDCGKDGIAYHTGHRRTKDEREAMAFDTREKAEQMRALGGLYQIMGWTTMVVPSVMVSSVQMTEVVRTEERKTKQRPPVKRPKVKVDKRGQYSLF